MTDVWYESIVLCTGADKGDWNFERWGDDGQGNWVLIGDTGVDIDGDGNVDYYQWGYLDYDNDGDASYYETGTCSNGLTYTSDVGGWTDGNGNGIAEEWEFSDIDGDGIVDFGDFQYTHYLKVSGVYDVYIYPFTARSEETTLQAPDTQAPTKPTLTANAPSSDQVNLSMSATDNVGVAGYNIYRGGTKIATVTAGTYSDTGRTAGTSYSYQVEAFDAAGNVSVKSDAVSATTPSVDVAALITEAKAYLEAQDISNANLKFKAALAGDAANKDRLNARVKNREPFRPFAPAVLAAHAAEYFDLAGPSPFMGTVFPARAPAREQCPAVVHVDGSARVQTVSPRTQPGLAAWLQEFAAETGVPVLLNTSFNVRGEPIVQTAEDALRCFFSTGIDALALGPFWLEKP